MQRLVLSILICLILPLGQLSAHDTYPEPLPESFLEPADSTKPVGGEPVLEIIPLNPRKKSTKFVRPGERLKIITDDGRMVKGTLMGLNDTHLDLSGHSVAIDEIAILKRPSKDLAAKTFGAIVMGGGYLLYTIDNRNNGGADKKNNNALFVVAGGALLMVTRHGHYDAERFRFKRAFEGAFPQ